MKKRCQAGLGVQSHLAMRVDDFVRPCSAARDGDGLSGQSWSSIAIMPGGVMEEDVDHREAKVINDDIPVERGGGGGQQVGTPRMVPGLTVLMRPRANGARAGDQTARRGGGVTRGGVGHLVASVGAGSANS